MIRFVLSLMIVFVTPVNLARAQTEPIVLLASAALQDSGVLRFLLPRFGLKTGLSFDVRIADKTGILPPDADVMLTEISAKATARAQPFMVRDGQIYYVLNQLSGPDGAGRQKSAQRFVDWLLSDIGRRTIGQFKINGAQVFVPADKIASVVAAVEFDGDARAGQSLSYKNCGRCHVIGEKNRMKGVDSTPSFGLMRTFPDWQRRFETFFTLNPHPSFSQITGVTEAFDIALPPAIFPLVLTPQDLDDIVAFVATIEPIDLGEALVHQ